jgi:hypothetical protein
MSRLSVVRRQNNVRNAGFVSVSLDTSAHCVQGDKNVGADPEPDAKTGRPEHSRIDIFPPHRYSGKRP